MDAELLTLMQKKVAVSAIPPSAMRGQGLAGLLGEIRLFLSELELDALADMTEEQFARRLDLATGQLRKRVTHLRCQWGAARKALNLFLRDATYNHYLRKRYRLPAIEQWLELPLDGEVAARLRVETGGSSLPRWPGVRALSAPVSHRYQDFAATVASRRELARVHLDLDYWPAFSRAAV